MKEYHLLSKINHPNIIKMHDAYVNHHRDTIYLVMDFIEGWTLKNYIKYYKLKHRDRKHLTAGGLPETICNDLI